MEVYFQASCQYHDGGLKCRTSRRSLGVRVLARRHSLEQGNRSLSKMGYESIPQMIAQQKGSGLLVGHSYGRAVIIDAGNHLNVVAGGVRID